MENRDRKILEAFRDNPSEATFRPVYEATKDLVYTICYRALRSEDDAGDALQGVYGRLLAWARESRGGGGGKGVRAGVGACAGVGDGTGDGKGVVRRRGFFREGIGAGKDGAKADRDSGMADQDSGGELLYLLRRLAWLESDRVRKQRNRRLGKETTVETFPTREAGGESPREAAEAREQRVRLQAVVETLPERDRIPVVLHYFHGMTHREIAEMTGEPLATISSRIQRALRKLRPMAMRAGLGEITTALAVVSATTALLSPPSALGASSVFGAAEAVAAKIAAGVALSGVTATTTATTATTTLLIGKIAATVALVVGVGVVAPYVLTKSAPPDSPSPTAVVEVSSPTTLPAPTATLIETRSGESGALEPGEPGLGTDAAAIPSDSSLDGGAGVVQAESTSGTLQAAVVEGRAFDVRTGQGVAGVRFRAASSNARPGFGKRALSLLIGSGRREAVTSSDGSFRLPVEPGERSLSFELPAGWVVAEQSATGPRGALPLPDPDGKGVRTVALALRQGVIVSGRVLDVDGASGVAGAQVNVCQGDRTEGLLSATTDDAGAFEFTVGSGGGACLIARTELGTAVKSVEFKSGQTRVQVDLLLRAFGSISGMVVDPSGAPQPGVAVSLRQIARTAAKDTAPDTEGCVCIDERIEVLSGGWSPNEASYGIGTRRVFVGGDGTLVEQRAGMGGTVTDGDGRFALLRVEAGSVELSCRPPMDSEFLAPAPLALSLGPAESLENVVIALIESDYISGTVFAESGAPIEGATVQWNSNEGGAWGSRSATTDAAGKYKLSGLRDDQVVQRIAASHADYEEATQANVSALDSPVDFVLKPIGGLVIRVVDPRGDTPPSPFQYRLLRHTWSGWDYVEEAQGVLAGPPDGVIRYRGAVDQDMRIEAVEVGGGVDSTGRRASAAFHFDPKDADPDEVVAPLLPAKTLRGVVKMADGNEPVDGATVAFEPLRSWSGWQIYKPVPPFDPMPAVTGVDGSFSLTHLAAGSYTLAVSKGALKPAEAPTIEVPETGDPEPVTVLLARGAVLFGKVIGPDGQPLTGATIRAMQYQSFGDAAAGFSSGTDAEGRYRIDGLEGKRYRVVALPGVADLPEREEFPVMESGKEQELDFDYSNTVHLSGQAFVDGRAWSGGLELRLLTVGGADSYSLNGDGSGGYEVTVPPGEYDLAVLGRTNVRNFSRRFAPQTQGAIAHSLTLNDSPREQQRDFDIALVAADVYFDLPEDQTPPDGVLELSVRIGGRVRDHLDVAPVKGRTVHFLDLPVGEYKVTYRSDDGERRGESAWTALAAGGQNALVVFLDSTRRERVGEWTPEQMTESFVTLPFDASAAIDSPGDYEVFLRYDKGVHGVAIREVALMAGGNVVALDSHPGWTGTYHFGNVYRLSIPQIPPGGGLVLRVSLRCDGGTDSQGSVFVMKVK